MLISSPDGYSAFCEERNYLQKPSWALIQEHAAVFDVESLYSYSFVRPAIRQNSSDFTMGSQDIDMAALQETMLQLSYLELREVIDLLRAAESSKPAEVVPQGVPGVALSQTP